MFLLIPALTLPIVGVSAAGPELTATPDAASAGTLITVRGSNFSQDLAVVLAWDGEQLDGDDLMASGGSFEATVKIPAGSAVGEHTLSAGIVAETTETSEASTQSASTSVVVTADEEPAPEPPTPVEPSAPPTEAPPTGVPPTEVPTEAPVATPTEVPPTAAPTEAPTPVPATPQPTPDPTPTPTATAAPTATLEATPAPTATAPTPPPATPVPTATPIAATPPPPAVTPPPAAALPPPPAPPAAPPAPVAAPVLVPALPAILPIIPAPKKVPRKTPCADGKFYVEYFNEMALAKSLRRKTRCESYVSKDWGLGSPGFGLRSNWFSVRWTTRVNLRAGTYRFNYQADNGIRVWVDGVLVVDRWYGGGSGWVARSIKGGRHLIRVAYFEDAGSAKAILSYKRISKTLTLTPPQMPVLIAPPVQSPKPALVISPPPPVTNPVPVLPPPPAPVVPPPPVQAPTPPPAAPPAGLPGPVSCSTPLATLINNAAAGSTLNLGSCVYTSSIDIRKPIRLYGGIYRLPRGATAVNISADDVTIEGARFEGGGYTVQVHGKDRARILNSSFTGMTETSIGINGPSADDTLIQGNTIIQTVRTSHGYSPISGQGFGRGKNNRLIIRNNTIDQGPSGVAWFGVEVWDNVGLVIEGNLLKGASALVSIPRSDGAIVRNNQFDMTQAFWGIELADVDDAQVYGNNVWGSSGNNGPDGRAFVQMHPGSGTVLRNTVRNNRLTNYWALVNAAGSGHTITNNCLSGVKKLTAFSFTGATTISGNGPC